jgi:hypothetical protein
MAATSCEAIHQGFEEKHATHDLIETFLKLGCKPSHRLKTCQAPRKTLTDNEPMTIWKFVVSDSARKSEILKLSLSYGARTRIGFSYIVRAYWWS